MSKNQSWEERVLVVRFLAHAEKGRGTLEKRLEQAKEALFAFSPPAGRGKQQIKSGADLTTAAEAVLTECGVNSLLISRRRTGGTRSREKSGRAGTLPHDRRPAL